ncbi:MAG: hypothetical protein M3396_03555 [Actinomycetota bacterium]|nr:hypothetical protein [Actinomycetota bacterium]
MGLRETFARHAAGPSRQLLALLAVVIVLLGVLAYGAAPFSAAGGLKCGGALLGSKPKEPATTGLLVGREKSVCRSKGNSRLIITGLATVAALTVGLGAAFLPMGPLEELFVRRDQ